MWSALLCAVLMSLERSAPSVERDEPGAHPADAELAGEAEALLLLTEDTPASLEAQLVSGSEAQLATLDATLEVEHRAAEVDDFATMYSFASELAETQPSPTLVAWLETMDDGSTALYLLDPRRRDRVFLRELAPAGSAELTIAENLALVLRRALMTVLEGGDLDEGATVVNVQEPSRPRSASTSDVSPPELFPVELQPCDPSELSIDEEASVDEQAEAGARGLFRATVSYSGGNLARQRPWHGGVALGLAWRHRSGARVGLGYTVLPSVQIVHPVLVLRVVRHPVELSAGYRALWPRFTVAGELALTVDVISQSTVTRVEGFVATGNPVRAVFGLVPRVDVGYALLPAVWLVASAGVEIVPRALSYEAEIADANEVLLSPARVRAQLRAGVAFSF